MRHTMEAVQKSGNYGFVKEHHEESLMRDAKIMLIFKGASEVQRILVSRNVLNER